MGAGVRDNHKVIRIADKVAWYQIAPFAQSMKSGFWSGIRCMGFLALPLTGNPFIHDIQIHICQQRTDESSPFFPGIRKGRLFSQSAYPMRVFGCLTLYCRGRTALSEKPSAPALGLDGWGRFPEAAWNGCLSGRSGTRPHGATGRPHRPCSRCGCWC